MKNEERRSINSNYKWVMLALIWLVYFAGFMIVSSIPPLVTPIAHDLSLTYSQVGFILGTVLLAYIPLAVPVGLIIDRIGTKRSLMIGIASASLSGILGSFATNFETLFLSVFIFGLGGPFISVGSPKIVASWFFGRDRGVASGIYVTGASIGGSTALAITNTLIMPLVGTWRNTLRLYGLFGLLIAFICLLFAREATHAQTGSTKAVPLREAITKLLRDKYVWIVAIIGFSSLFFAGYGLGRWLPKLLELNGMSPAEAGFFASVPGWSGLIGSVVIPSLGKAGSRKPLVFIVLMVQGICIFIVGVAIGWTLIVSLVFYGISSAATFPLLIAILMDLPQVGAEYMGAAGGILFSIGGLGSFIGPLMVGFLADLTGSILPGVIALAVVVEAMLVFTLLMKEK
jgi:cyanate permease